MGVVTNGSGGTPVIGAKISVNNQSVYSTAGGLYTINIDPPGTYAVSCTKTGFDLFQSIPVMFQAGVTTTLNISLLENLNPPVAVLSQLDTVAQKTMISWQVPSGNYELVYDDGIQENFTVWASAGNMNAVKFTPAGYPAIITGGSVHIGNPGNYPAGSNPLVPFQVKILDASGAGGTPGNLLAGPFDVIPAALGWVSFNIPGSVTIAAGSFYLVMIQGGNAPDAAGLAVDETTPQFRSYARFVSGNGPWFPASGNFMMRATLSGTGGPVDLAENTGSINGYQVWRLRQGEELNPGIWTSVGFTAATHTEDFSWPSLPCGPYRWAVKAQYSANRWSVAAFSNITGKCWTAPVTVNISLSCLDADPGGTHVMLRNLVYPDTVYSVHLDTTGTVTFPSVWKGTYELHVSRFGYQQVDQTLPVMTGTTTDVFLLQVKSEPSNLVVDNKSLIAVWNAPHFDSTLFSEDWAGGSFATNGWTTEGGVNWMISSSSGNPAPSAMFYWSPHQSGYSQSLTSVPITGQRSPLMKLGYDIFLDNFGTTTLNEMAVEIWDGTAWNTLKTYQNSGGNITWTTETVDIAAYANLTFRIRFRASGGDTYDINSWNIDNISVVAAESDQLLANCILGYNFYLDNVTSGFTAETKYTIPGEQVQYGSTYNACVAAAYGSGVSEKVCVQFTSAFLWPARNLNGTAIEDVAALVWEKPRMPLDTGFITPAGLIGYSIYRNDTLIDTIPGADNLEYYDTGLEPGSYDYTVGARYDLSSYGFPGQTDESAPAGPVTLSFNYGRELPFLEPWDNGSFSFNDWRFTPDQGNWIMDMTDGNPLPAAAFKWDPPVTGYASALESPALDGSPFHCASIRAGFDLKLEDRNNTGEENLFFEVFYNNSWHRKAEFSNTGSFGWIPCLYDISAVKGKGFRVRFRAKGVNSENILAWQIDNVSIYAICNPARNLSGEAIGYDARLTWSAPDCNGGAALLNEGFENESFPPDGWSDLVTNPGATWSHTGPASPVGVHSGNYSAGLVWDYNHQDEWLIAHNVYVGGDLAYWSNAFQGSSHGDHYYVKISIDQGATWDILSDLSAMPAYPSANGYNEWQTPYSIDLSFYQGETVDLAWHAVDGNGQGLWYSWAIDDCTIGSDRIEFTTEQKTTSSGRGQLLGYDLFRRENGAVDFLKVNGNLIPDTVYVDQGLNAGQFEYYVVPVFAECDQAANSDTVTVDVITSAGELEAGETMKVYPNPAADFMYIECNETITSVEILDLLGRTVLTWSGHHAEHALISVAGLNKGLYLLRATAADGRHSRMISVSR